MVHTEFDELFADSKRHQPLHSLSRQIKLLGNIILGTAANKIEPSSLGGLVSALVDLFCRFAHEPPLFKNRY